MRQKKQLHNNMPTQSLFTSMTGFPVFCTNTTARCGTDHLRPPPPPYRRHGTAQAVYAPPPPPSRTTPCVALVAQMGRAAAISCAFLLQDISLRSMSVVYATGYNTHIRGIGANFISVALRPEDIRRSPWYMTRGY